MAPRQGVIHHQPYDVTLACEVFGETEIKNWVSHFEEGWRYFTHVLDEDIASRLPRFKKYKVFSDGNDNGRSSPPDTSIA